MKLLNLFTYIRKPWLIIDSLNSTKIRTVLPDKLVICCCYRTFFGRKLDLKDPKTFNEKLQWIKLYDRNPQYSMMVDKYEAKRIVGSIIGDEHIIPTYGIWNSVNDIDWESLPNSFVMKTTHDSHTIVICKDKALFDIEKAKRVLQSSLKRNYFFGGREWPYKNVKPRILAEKYMSDNGEDLVDYKIHCFNGKPRFILVCTDRYSSAGLKEVFYDLRWNKIPVRRPKCDIDKIDIPKPEQLSEMEKIAENLSKDIPFVRVDLYIIKHSIYFGELTLFPASGYKKFIPDEYDSIFGDYLNLPRHHEKDKE